MASRPIGALPNCHICGARGNCPHSRQRIAKNLCSKCRHPMTLHLRDTLGCRAAFTAPDPRFGNNKIVVMCGCSAKARLKLVAPVAAEAAEGEA